MKRVAASLLAALLVAGCGEGQDSTTAQEQATRELQEAQKELRKERRRLQRERRQEPRKPKTSPEETSASDDSGSGSSGGTGRIPDVEGKDHQLAQDTMQAAGFYMLSEEDSSGEARPILYDRNWTVVSQSPKPGTRAPLDRTIVLRVKKDGE